MHSICQIWGPLYPQILHTWFQLTVDVVTSYASPHSLEARNAVLPSPPESLQSPAEVIHVHPEASVGFRMTITSYYFMPLKGIIKTREAWGCFKICPKKLEVTCNGHYKACGSYGPKHAVSARLRRSSGGCLPYPRIQKSMESSKMEPPADMGHTCVLISKIYNMQISENLFIQVKDDGFVKLFVME